MDKYTVGQNVIVLHDEYRHVYNKKQIEELLQNNIKHYRVLKIGRKYITVGNDYFSVAFDIKDDYREQTKFCQTYFLYPDIETLKYRLNIEASLLEIKDYFNCHRDIPDEIILKVWNIIWGENQC